MTEQWSEFEIAREAFFDTYPDFQAMDHADVVTWHNLAREAERGEMDDLTLTLRYGNLAAA